MFTVFRRLLVCLLWLWLPLSQAADSGWLRAADNQHASVRLRAQPESTGETRLLLDVALQKGWKTYWRSPGEGGVAPAIKWHQPVEAIWRWPVPQRFDVAGITTQGYHGDVSFPLTLRGDVPTILSGVLTLSTCSNVCILTDYPFSLNMTASAGASFDYDFSRAMGTLPLSGGLTSTLNATYAPGKLTVTAQRDAGWQAPSLFIDGMDDVDFGKPALTVRGDSLVATVPVTDSWGEAAPNLSGKTLSLVLADSGQAQESSLSIQPGNAAPTLPLGWVLLMALAGHRLALPLANGTARRGISCTGGRGGRVCFRLRRRGLPPRSYSLAAAQRAGHCPRAGGEQTGVRRRDRRLVRDL